MIYPTFSIVIPTYQRKDLVCDALRAISKIDYSSPVEVIVVVDGSTDRTAAALADVACHFPLHVIEQPNHGAAAARNRGASAASGDILLFLDDDMMCDPDVLAEHARLYGAGADAVVGRFTEPAVWGRRFASRPNDRNSAGPDETIHTPFDIFGGHLSVRRSAFEKVGGFDESFTEGGKYGYEDFDFGYRLLRQFAVRVGRDAVCYHRKLIGPREYVRRARSCADAELFILKKHPELRRHLVEQTGAARISKRLRLLIGLPVLPGLLAQLGVSVVEVGSRTPLRSTRMLRHVLDAAYTLTYWSAVRRNGGISDL